MARVASAGKSDIHPEPGDLGAGRPIEPSQQIKAEQRQTGIAAIDLVCNVFSGECYNTKKNTLLSRLIIRLQQLTCKD